MIDKRYFVKIICSIFVVSLFLGDINATYAEDIENRVRLNGRLLAGHIRSALAQNDIALLAVADFLAANPGVSDEIIHARLKRYAVRGAGMRAVLGIDPTGQLRYDSFSLPAPDLNLSGRHYVRKALGAESADLIVGGPVIGKQSGLPFIPLARPYFSINGARLGVVAGVMVPNALIEPVTKCTLCVAATYLETGETLVTYPSGAKLPRELLEEVVLSPDTSSLTRVSLAGTSTIVFWEKIASYGVIAIYAETERAGS